MALVIGFPVPCCLHFGCGDETPGFVPLERLCDDLATGVCAAAAGCCAAEAASDCVQSAVAECEQALDGLTDDASLRYDSTFAFEQLERQDARNRECQAPLAYRAYFCLADGPGCPGEGGEPACEPTDVNCAPTQCRN